MNKVSRKPSLHTVWACECSDQPVHYSLMRCRLFQVYHRVQSNVLIKLPRLAKSQRFSLLATWGKSGFPTVLHISEWIYIDLVQYDVDLNTGTSYRVEVYSVSLYGFTDFIQARPYLIIPLSRGGFCRLLQFQTSLICLYGIYFNIKFVVFHYSILFQIWDLSLEANICFNTVTV